MARGSWGRIGGVLVHADALDVRWKAVARPTSEVLSRYSFLGDVFVPGCWRIWEISCDRIPSMLTRRRKITLCIIT